MALKNCPNCGAPYGLGDKCQYCGTYLLDISTIPINEVFFLKLNVGTKENPQVITQKVYSTNAKFTITYDTYTEISIDFIGLPNNERR
jgi:hypothetical protein